MLACAFSISVVPSLVGPVEVRPMCQSGVSDSRERVLPLFALCLCFLFKRLEVEEDRLRSNRMTLASVQVTETSLSASCECANGWLLSSNAHDINSIVCSACKGMSDRRIWSACTHRRQSHRLRACRFVASHHIPDLFSGGRTVHSLDCAKELRQRSDCVPDIHWLTLRAAAFSQCNLSRRMRGSESLELQTRREK